MTIGWIAAGAFGYVLIGTALAFYQWGGKHTMAHEHHSASGRCNDCEDDVWPCEKCDPPDWMRETD